MDDQPHQVACILALIGNKDFIGDEAWETFFFKSYMACGKVIPRRERHEIGWTHKFDLKNNTKDL